MINKEVLSKIGISRPRELSEERLMGCFVSVTQEFKGQEFLMSYKGRGFLVRGDITAIKGRAKSGKTCYLSVLVATVLNGKFAGFGALVKDLKVLYIDTEQSLSNTQRIIKKALRMAGLPEQDNKRILPFNLREFTAEERTQALEMLVENSKPDIVIIDGIRDLLVDFNDIKESHYLISLLMKITKVFQCALIAVLHENKADQNMRGHAGTELTNKSSEVYQVSRSGDDERSFYKVTQTDTRNLPIDEAFTFQIGEDGLPQEVFVASPLTPSEKRKNTITENFNRFMEPGTSLTYTKLISSYMEATGLAEATAKKHLPEALDLGILIKNGDEYSRRIYME